MLFAINVAVYLVVGSAASFLAGLFGAGATLLILPFLMFYFTHIHGAPPFAIHTAAGTTIAIGAVVAFIGARRHFIARNYDTNIIKSVLPSYLIGGLSGAYISHFLSSHTLQNYIGCILVIAAIILCKPKNKATQRRQPKEPELFLLGLIIATACGAAAIATGLLMIPYLILRSGMEPHLAKGTSMIIGAAYAMVATIGFCSIGYTRVGYQDWTFGYIHLPAVVAFSLTACVMTPLGIKASKHAPKRILRPIYATYLALSGIYFIWH